MDVSRLDFSRGTVEKIDPSIPPRGWQAPIANPEREAAPQRGDDAPPDTASSAEQDEEVDQGLLDPPYDERTITTDGDLSAYDAGPARLVALMTLAVHADALRFPRAPEWIDAARAGIPVVPPHVLPEMLRDLWSGVG